MKSTDFFQAGFKADFDVFETRLLTKQCLARRVDSIDKLQKEVAVWEKERNAKLTPIHWHFTIDKARTKLVSIYPDLPE
ncbi:MULTISPECIES: hypothetical protein [unclassified Selenomonas]|uniref:hypothetical protein n=1 Tax=unclassified Selenomonas TaxID=2637378 RepID=UPI0009441853